MAKALSDQINAARLMLAGAKDKAEALKSIGITEDDITTLSTAYNETIVLDEKQEKLKAELKTCTADLSEKSKNLNNLVSAMRKRVKLVIPQTEWTAFGITSQK